MAHSFYRERIAQLAPDRDPAPIEAYMRLAYGTLDHLSPQQFAEEVAVCAACVDADPEAAAVLTQSYGL